MLNKKSQAVYKYTQTLVEHVVEMTKYVILTIYIFVL